uniref:AAA-like domain-containing protein n=1 Tax=Candidatus Kentrum sp. TUN TaxID=2126343 RepID=A0A450ZEL4_9GAMM|nr:MAG: AAA-like domain-containing protein [Candidatus Kentron sp. TUN]
MRAPHRKTMRYFNTAGPVIPGDHYNIPALLRWDMDEIRRLIREKRYFVLHAPRQTGKTSCLLALMKKLNEEGDYTALYVNLEPAQAARENVEAGMRTIISGVTRVARRYLDDNRLEDWSEETFRKAGPYDALQSLLSRWSEENQKPIVLLLDEVDTLVGDTLISFLRQIRAGYSDRPDAFPQTVLLCGVRDVQDYRIHTADNRIITGGQRLQHQIGVASVGKFRPRGCDYPLCATHRGNRSGF